MTNDLWTQRTARARAFIGQPLKPGHAWSEKRYAYDKEHDDDAVQETHPTEPNGAGRQADPISHGRDDG